jgi:2-polyprenyl-3-methyl-5-hydroxy-6-metoxy-1,4-benzoquinol methylase
MNYERIDNTPIFDGKTRDSHELRYRIASGFVGPDDTVLDAGCGTGYGRDILRAKVYIGLDKNPISDSRFTYYDFEENYKCTIFDSTKFDVFVGLEIIEHLDPVGYFIRLARNARKWIVISTPIVPNSNPFHKQQFTEDMIVAMFNDDPWKHYGTVTQDGRYGIFIFKRI